MTQWASWLAAEKAAGRGGIVWPFSIVPGVAFNIEWPIPADVSGDSFSGGVALSPDPAGGTLEDFSVTVGSFSGGVTLVTFTLSASQTGDAGDLPGVSTDSGTAEVLADFYHTPAAGAKQRIAVLSIPISGPIP